MAKKRALPFNSSILLPPNAAESWNPMSWNWDSARFLAKALQCDGGRVGRDSQSSASCSRNPISGRKDDANLLLKLGAGKETCINGDMGGISLVEPQPVSRPNKRVRLGSPGGMNYPVCQEENCKEDLSTAKTITAGTRSVRFTANLVKPWWGIRCKGSASNAAGSTPFQNLTREREVVGVDLLVIIGGGGGKLSRKIIRNGWLLLVSVIILSVMIMLSIY